MTQKAKSFGALDPWSCLFEIICMIVSVEAFPNYKTITSNKSNIGRFILLVCCPMAPWHYGPNPSTYLQINGISAPIYNNYKYVFSWKRRSITE